MLTFMGVMNILAMNSNASAMNVMKELRAIIAEKQPGITAKSLINTFMRRVYES
jgi:hypothetical protein